MFELLKTFLFGYEPKPQDLPPQSQAFYPVFDQPQGGSWPVEFARRGWRPQRFANSNVVVFLPPQLAVRFTADGVLHATIDTPEPAVSATLQRGFEDAPEMAFDFVAHLAQQKQRPFHDVGSCRCFYDPTWADPNQIAERHFVIGLPGAVVVLTIRGTRDNGATPLLQEVRQAVPYLVALTPDSLTP